MIPEDPRRLLDLYLDLARTTDSKDSARHNLDHAIGMIGYALSNGDLTPAEHAGEWAIIKLIREQRANARRAQR